MTQSTVKIAEWDFKPFSTAEIKKFNENYKRFLERHALHEELKLITDGERKALKQERIRARGKK